MIEKINDLSKEEKVSFFEKCLELQFIDPIKMEVMEILDVQKSKKDFTKFTFATKMNTSRTLLINDTSINTILRRM